MKKVIIYIIMITSIIFLITGCEKTKPVAKEREILKIDDTERWKPFDPPIKVSAISSYGVPITPGVPEDTTPENQTWIEIYSKYLGIDIEYDWIVPSSQYEQKLDITIASGSIPDVMMVNAEQFEILKEGDMLGDLTGLWDYMVEPIRNDLEPKDIFIRSSTNERGELVGIPTTGDERGAVQLIYLREDWIDNLGLELPTTFDELEEIMRQFTFNDPDQNGKDDTYGLALTKELSAGIYGMDGVFHAYGSYPDRWIKGDDGKLVNGDILPETRDALLRLQKMYAEGLINREYVAMSSSSTTEDLVAGRVGVMFGQWWNPNYPLNISIDANPDARWKAMNIVSAVDGEVARSPISKRQKIGKYFVVSKDFEHPEALFKLMNVYYEFAADRSFGGPDYDEALFEEENGFVYEWTPIRIEDAFQIDRQYKLVNEALENKDKSILFTNSQTMLYDQTIEIQEGKMSSEAWGGYYSRVAKDGGWGLTVKASEEGLTIEDEFYGIHTPTMITNKGSLDTLKEEVWHRIITGSPIEEYDKFVKDWKLAGGDQITKEVNEWYNSQ